MNKIKITIDDKEIKFFSINTLFTLFNFLRKGIRHEELALSWNEIEELDTNYILYPETPTIILKPKKELNKEPITFVMFGIPVQLLSDILSHLPPETKIYLYSYLKKMLERKPDTKRKIIIIAILLTLTVIGGFLFSWFIWK